MSLVDYEYELGEEDEIQTTQLNNKMQKYVLLENSLENEHQNKSSNNLQISEIISEEDKNEILNDVNANAIETNSSNIDLMPDTNDLKASYVILDKIKRLKELQKVGTTLNANIANSIDFKNPYLLEKIMDLFGIYAYSSNYPPLIFDPKSIPQAERIQHQKRKIEQINTENTSKAKNEADVTKIPEKRVSRFSSKWDEQPSTTNISSSINETVQEVVKSAKSRLANVLNSK